MSIGKPTLAIAALVLDLAGGFLLAIQMLAGVNQSLRSILAIRARLRRLRRRVLRRLAVPKSLAVTVFQFGNVEPSDDLDLTPIFYALALISLGFVTWRFSDQIGWALMAPHHAVGHLARWIKYPLQALFVFAEIGVVLVALAIGFVVSANMLALVAVVVIGVIAAMLALLGIPARILFWISRGKERDRERKIGWIGFYLLIVAFVLQAGLNLM